MFLDMQNFCVLCKKVFYVSTINLHKYHDQINLLLEDSQYSLASNHCRYILQQYPRHVDTYRLLAKALIEQGDYSGATQLFQRVLSADPNDFISHAGLSVVYREGDVLTQSLWHLERAYEIEPYNGAIQQELKSLYIEFSELKAKQQRGDVEVDVPESLPLTKGALARLYIQGELYAQAIDVLREALAEDIDRIDLEVLLAEALWRDNQRVAAVQICLQVLEKLPNCITANAILAEIWLQTGRTDEAQQYLQDLQALTLMDVACQDLESPAGSAFQPEGAIALPAVFEVDRMGDDDMSSMMDAADAPSSDGEDGVLAEEESDAYQWLEGLGDEFVLDEKDDSSDLSVMTTDSDWLRRELVASDEETAVSDDLSDWLNELAEPDGDQDESGIDTLGVLAAGAVAAGVIGKQVAEDDSDSDELGVFGGNDDDDESFDWLSEEGVAEAVPEDDETVFAQIEQAEEAEEMPDWLADMSGEALEPVQVNPIEISDYLNDDEEPDYLSGTNDTEEDEEDIYDWLKNENEDDAETAEELNAGDFDLSQFAEFGAEKAPDDDDEEVVWRLTDELNLLTEDDSETVKEEALEEFDFEISLDETGELEDIPDWLLGSHGTDELEVASAKEVAGNEIADELADWVAANQDDAIENDDLSDWLADETAVSNTPAVEPIAEVEEEDDFFTSDLPSWMVDSPTTIPDSAPLNAESSLADETAAEAEETAAEADLPDWLTGGSMSMDDSGLLDTGSFSDESSEFDADSVTSESDDDLPDWLMADGGTVETEGTEETEDDGLLDWLYEDEDDEDDNHLGTAVAGGLLGAMAAGALAKEFLDDDNDEDQPEQLVIDSGLEEEVMEDAVSDKQDDLIDPQDKPDKPDDMFQEESDGFDWLDDLDDASVSAQNDPLPINDLGDALDWMDLDDDAGTDDLNLDALLGLETEADAAPENVVEKVIEPVVVGLADDESLDWLDALSDGEPEAVDEMPTWQWPEDEDVPDSVSNAGLDASDAEESLDAIVPVDDELDALFADEPAEADVVEDLDDAMAWLENLAGEPDAPVEELPSVAEDMDMDLDSLFGLDSDLDAFDDLSGESMQTESLDEIFAADTQNDSWLEGLGSGEEPLPDFLEDDSVFNLDGLLDEPVAETAVTPESSEMLDDVGEPPEDIDDAMAWLEKLAARQGAPLDELPSVETDTEEEDGIGVVEIAAGAAALGALGAVLSDDDDEGIESLLDSDDEEVEIVTAGEDLGLEDDLLAFEVPEDPDEAMAWLEKLAARQGAPLDELPSVAEDEYEDLAEAATVENEDDWFNLDADDSSLDDLLAEPVAMFGNTDAEDDSLDDLDETMAWLDGLGADDAAAEDVPSELADFNFDDEELDLFEFAEEAEPVKADTEAEAPTSPPADDLGDELDWLETIVGSDEAVPAYNAADVSVSDDELADALEKLTLLTAVGIAAGAVVADEDEPEVEEVEVETAVIEAELEAEATFDDSADDFIESMPEDPDEAMAWLEKLAARQGAPLDELPSVAEDEYDDLAAAGAAAMAIAAAEADVEDEADAFVEELEPELAVIFNESEAEEEIVAAVDPGEMDMDDAMAWLEQLAARQGTSLDELPTVDESDLEKETIAPDWVAADAQIQAEQEALIVGEPVIKAIDEIEEDEIAEVVPPEDMDMDDAMAWLEKLAARQGTPLDELPTVDAVPEAEDDFDTPTWIAQQTGPLDESVLDSLDLPEVSDEAFDMATDDDFFAALDEVPAIEGIETGVQGSGAPDLEDIDDSLPDWLSGEEEGEDPNPLGHTGWLNALDEPDMDGWLAAEAEATESSDISAGDMPKAVDTDSLISTGGLEDTGSLSERERRGGTGELRFPGSDSRGSLFTTELDEAQVLADLDMGDLGDGLDQAQLASARNGLAGGDIEAALLDYQNLVEAGESMHTVISDLERASELHQDKPMVRRMLGDAYMRNGQINKAIETYREALDQM